jgi:hypothetical protein
VHHGFAQQNQDRKMRIARILLVVSVGILSACTGETSPEPGAQAKDTSAVGSDRDAHGCISSAGYRWCAKENECKRPWELAEEKGLDATPEAFDDHCRNETE